MVNQKICDRVLNKLKTSVFSNELCVIEPKMSKKLQISTLNLIACKAIIKAQHYDKVKNCMWIASAIGANMELLKNIMRDVIFKSNVLKPMLNKCTIRLVAFWMMSEKKYKGHYGLTYLADAGEKPGSTPCMWIISEIERDNIND